MLIFQCLLDPHLEVHVQHIILGKCAYTTIPYMKSAATIPGVKRASTIPTLTVYIHHLGCSARTDSRRPRTLPSSFFFSYRSSLDSMHIKGQVLTLVCWMTPWINNEPGLLQCPLLIIRGRGVAVPGSREGHRGGSKFCRREFKPAPPILPEHNLEVS